MFVGQNILVDTFESLKEGMRSMIHLHQFQSTTPVNNTSLPHQSTAAVYHTSLPHQLTTSVYHISLPHNSTCIFPPYKKRPKTYAEKFFSFQIIRSKSFPNNNFPQTKLFHIYGIFCFYFP